MYSVLVGTHWGETYNLEREVKIDAMRLAAQVAISGLTLVKDGEFIAIPFTSIEIVRVKATGDAEPITEEDLQTVISQEQDNIESLAKMMLDRETN